MALVENFLVLSFLHFRGLSGTSRD